MKIVLVSLLLLLVAASMILGYMIGKFKSELEIDVITPYLKGFKHGQDNNRKIINKLSEEDLSEYGIK